MRAAADEFDGEFYGPRGDYDNGYGVSSLRPQVSIVGVNPAVGRKLGGPHHIRGVIQPKNYGPQGPTFLIQNKKREKDPRSVLSLAQRRRKMSVLLVFAPRRPAWPSLAVRYRGSRCSPISVSAD